MTQADKLVHLTQQLVGDISRLPGVVLDSATEAQLVQLLTDAFEQVGNIALDGWTERPEGMYPTRICTPGVACICCPPVPASNGHKACGCKSGQSCHTCLPLPGGITF